MLKYKVEVDDKRNIRWYKWDTNQRHREDGPAVEYTDGSKFWYLNGKRHRKDGPACEWADGSKEWYLNGEELTEQEFHARQSDCNSKVVEIDGKKYRLELV